MLNYGENYIYPGFLEAHSHGYFAGDRAIGQANLMQVGLTDYVKYREIIKEFIQKNPQRELYVAAGWAENDEYVSKTYLDEICADKPLIMQTVGGHSMLLNTKALEWAGIDAACTKKSGYDMVHVDANGEPDGYICEKNWWWNSCQSSPQPWRTQKIPARMAGYGTPKWLYRRRRRRSGAFLSGFSQGLPRAGGGRQAEAAHL